MSGARSGSNENLADIPTGKLLALVGLQAGLFTGLGFALWWF